MKHTYTDEEIQAAIDAACNTTTNPGYTNLDIRTTCPGWQREAPARLHLLKSALDKLPEPQPPTADGKTPGQVCHESMYNTPEWKWLLAGDKAACEAAASAVLAAFGGAGLEQAIARMESVPLEELEKAWDSASCDESLANAFNEVRARLIAAAREGHDPAAVDWKARHDELQKAYAGHADVTAALHDKVQKAEAELAMSEAAFSNYRGLIFSTLNEVGAPTHHPDVGASARKPMTPQERIKALCGLSTLRPIAEAGGLPAGVVRIVGFNGGEGAWAIGSPHFNGATHFADILLPEAKAPAVEAAGICTDCGGEVTHREGKPGEFDHKCDAEKPATTFTAHGKTWNVHEPGDPMPCDGEARIEVIYGKKRGNSRFDKAHGCNWENGTSIIGWRYADEPTPAEPVKPWTPAVGDVVTLKSGGPKMTVVSIKDSEGHVVWFQAGTPRECDFHVATLQPA